MSSRSCEALWVEAVVRSSGPNASMEGEFIVQAPGENPNAIFQYDLLHVFFWKKGSGGD